MPRPSDELEACPKCGVKLLHRGLSHSCGDFTVDAFLARAGEPERALFRRFVDCIATCGPFSLAPAKTRVAFLAKVRFASVNRIGPGYVDVHLVLPRQIVSERWRKVERIGKVWVHHLRLTRRGDLDTDLRRWIRESYRDYGERRWLEGRRKPRT